MTEPDPVDALIAQAQTIVAQLDADRAAHVTAIATIDAKRAKLQQTFGIAPPPAPAAPAIELPPLPRGASDYDRIAREMAQDGA